MAKAIIKKPAKARQHELSSSIATGVWGIDGASQDKADRLNIGAVVSDFAMSKAALAGSLGLPAEVFYVDQAEKTDKNADKRLREFLTIMARVEPWAGGPQQAINWYRNQPISSLGNETAEALVQQDKGGHVRSYLDQYAAGGFA